MFTRLTALIESNHWVHTFFLGIWRLLPPRVMGKLRSFLASKWVVGAAAVMVDDTVVPPETLLVRHTYRRSGAWGFPGGMLQIGPKEVLAGRSPDATSDNVLRATLRREVIEETGLNFNVVQLAGIEAGVPVPEEGASDRLDFYFRCVPEQGYEQLRHEIREG